MRRVGASGQVRLNSGIGVIQRVVHPILAAQVELIESPSRDVSGRGAELRGLVTGLRPPGRGLQGYFCSVSPLPLRVRTAAPVVTIVHDLRWQRSEPSWIKRAYRAWDLRRAVRLSDTLLCVSQRTLDDLIAFAPEAAEKAEVAWLGPGLVADDAWSDGIPGRALLLQPAPHKRNELAAEVMSLLPRELVSSVVGINVSEETRRICEEGFGAASCRWTSRVSDEQLLEEYRQASWYVHLGTDEGFGMPYVEAMASGCSVVAIDQPLTREILGTDTAVLLPDSTPGEMAAAWASHGEPAADARRQRVERFSWHNFAAAVYRGLRLG